MNKIVKKVTAFALSGLIAVSSMIVGSTPYINTNSKVNAAQTDTKKSGATKSLSWYGKGYADIVKDYADVQVYNDNIVDEDDLSEAFSAIRKDEANSDGNNILHVITINENSTDTMTITKPYSVPSDTFIKVNGTIKFGTTAKVKGQEQTQGRLTANGSKNICIQSATTSNNAKFILTGEQDNTDVTINGEKGTKGANMINITNGAENVVVRNIDFSTGTGNYSNSSFIYNNSANSTALSSLTFTGKVKRVYSGSDVSNTKFVNSKISSLTTATDESVVSISNSTKSNEISKLNIESVDNAKYILRVSNSNNTAISNTTINGNAKAIGIMISGSTNVDSNKNMIVYDSNSIANSTITNCLGRGVYITGAVKNTKIIGTGVTNTITDGSARFGISFYPNFTQVKTQSDNTDVNTGLYGTVNKEDYLAQITDCTSDDNANNCSLEGDACDKHIHNNGTGIYVNSQYLTNYSKYNNIPLLVKNNTICCNSDGGYGIRTSNNIYESKTYKVKIEVQNNYYSSNTKNEYGDGFTTPTVSEDEVDITENVVWNSDYSCYVGSESKLKYSLQSGKFTVTGYVGDATDKAIGYVFKIPSSVTLVSSATKYPVTAIGDRAFADANLGGCRLVIPSSIVSIGSRTFERASGIRSIYIGSSNLSIDEYAFMNCLDLSEIEVAKARKTSKGNEKFVSALNEDFYTNDGIIYKASNNNKTTDDSAHTTTYTGNLTLLSYPAKHTEHKEFRTYINTTSNVGGKSANDINTLLNSKEIYLYDMDTGECYFPSTKSIAGISGGTYIAFADVPNYAGNLSVHIGELVYQLKNGTKNRINGTDFYNSINLGYNSTDKVYSYVYNTSSTIVYNDVKVYIEDSYAVGDYKIDDINSLISKNQFYLYDTDSKKKYYPSTQTISSLDNSSVIFKNIPSDTVNLTVFVGDLTYDIAADANGKVELRANDGKIYNGIIIRSLGSVYGGMMYFSNYTDQSLLKRNNSLESYSDTYTVPNQTGSNGYDISNTSLKSISNSASNIIYRYYNVTEFEYRSFYNCQNLATLNINKNLSKFNYMKDGKDFTASAGPIDNCKSLKTITVDRGNTSFAVVTKNGISSLYSNDYTKFYLLPSASKAVNFELDSDVTSIANYAFSYNDTLESISYNGDGLYQIGIRAFYQSDNFKSINWTNTSSSSSPSISKYYGYDYSNSSKTQLTSRFTSLESFLNYSFTNHFDTIDNVPGYYPNKFGDSGVKEDSAHNFKLGYSLAFLNDNLNVNGSGNLFKKLVQNMYKPLYNGVLESVEEKALSVASSNMNSNFQDFMSGSATKFFNDQDSSITSNWTEAEKISAKKNGSENYDSSNSKKENNPSILNKTAKWTNKNLTKSEVSVDYAYGDNKTSYNFLFVLDKTGSMNEANSASRSKMYDQYSTVYNMSKAILADTKADNRVGIINFSDYSNTDMLNGSNGAKAKFSAGATKVNLDSKYFTTNQLSYIESYLSKTETEGNTYYDCGMTATNTVLSGLAKNADNAKRKTAVIFVSDGIPISGHDGEKEATALRNAFPDVPIYTILEFVSENNQFTPCEKAMGKISGYEYVTDISAKDYNTKIALFNQYNKSGKDSNELTKAFKDIYANFTSTPKQVLQDTISKNFTVDSNGITLERTAPGYDKINLAVDINKSFTELYNKLSSYTGISNTSGNEELQLVVSGSNQKLNPTKKFITDNHVRYVFEGVDNATGLTYKLISPRYKNISVSSNTTTDLTVEKALSSVSASKSKSQLSYGLLILNKLVTGETSFPLAFSNKLIATGTGNIVEEKCNTQSFSFPVPSTNSTKYYYLQKNTDGTAFTVTEFTDTSKDNLEKIYKNSLDGIVVKLYTDSNNQTHTRVFINDAQTLIKYSLKFKLSLKSDYTKVYGKYFETNDNGGKTNGTDSECFVVNNNDETITPSDNFSNYTDTSSKTTKIINKVPTPKLLRQKYGNITAKVLKETFAYDSTNKEYKYSMLTNSQSKESTLVSLRTLGDKKDVTSAVTIAANKDTYTFSNIPLYDSNGDLYEFTLAQESTFDRFNPVSNITIDSSELASEGNATGELNNYLKKGILKISKKAFDNIINGIYFKISNDNSYNEIVSTDNTGVAYPSSKKTSRGSTNYLPLYSDTNKLLNYTVTELGIKDGDSYSIPRKYKPKETSFTGTLKNYSTVTFDFDNLARPDFTVRIGNVNNNNYGKTGSLGSDYKVVDITNGVPSSDKPVSTNTDGKIYENEIGSFDVTFTNKVKDAKSALCEIIIDGKTVYSQNVSFAENGKEVVRVIYDYKWNITPRDVVARINYENRADEVVSTDNSTTATLTPAEWKDFSVKILGLYKDKDCTEKLDTDSNKDNYFYANKNQTFYIKAKFINKNKGRSYTPDVDIIYGDNSFKSTVTIPKGTATEDGYVIGSIDMIADSNYSVKDISVRINWDKRNEEANPNDNEDSVTLETRKVLDLSIEPVPANVCYYNGYDVVTSVMVYNKSYEEAVLPEDKVKVTFKVFVGEEAKIGTLCYQAQKEVVIPYRQKGDKFASNLVYFKWKVPTANKTSHIFWVATINDNRALFETDYSDNTTIVSDNGRYSIEKKNDDGSPYLITNEDCYVERKDYVTKKTPYTKYEETSKDGYIEKNVGKSFDYITPEDADLNEYNNQAVWSEWSYDTSTNLFIKHTYGETIGKFDIRSITKALKDTANYTAKLGKTSSHSETIITPDKNSPSVEKDEHGNYTMRSGYGFSLKYTPSIASFYAKDGVYDSNFDNLSEEDKAKKLDNATTGIQMASAYYPEFMYMDKRFNNDDGNTYYTCNTLERNVLGTNLFDFKLPMNKQSAASLTDHKEDSRIHFIPIWYKDGNYNISIVASYSWTPAGAISTCDNSTNINISGSMYDDWYLSGDAH